MHILCWQHNIFVKKLTRYTEFCNETFLSEKGTGCRWIYGSKFRIWWMNMSTQDEKTGLIDIVISYVGINNGMSKRKYTFSWFLPLVNNEDGALASISFNYRSIVGILLYLSRNTRLEISFAVNCCARYLFCPNHSSEEGFKWTGRYLKLTRDRGLILNPNREILKY